MEDPIDGSLLIGEGSFPIDLGEDVSVLDLGEPVEAGRDATEPPDLAAPDLGPPPDAGDPCAPEGLTVVPAAMVRASTSMLDGMQLRMTGTASVGAVVCSNEPCADGTQCCNRCRADLLVEGIRITGSECTVTSTVGCVGTPCTPLVCSPPLVVDLPAAFDGRVRDGRPPRFELFRRASP